MEIQKQALREWLEAWLQLPFYEKNYKCKKHEKQYNIAYCGVCKENPVCKICWDKYKSKEHQGHHLILQVVEASRRAAIDIEEISKFLDISEIQQYKINKRHVVYLNPHREGAPNPHRNPNCEICRRRLISSDYRFCSIACKNRSMDCDMQIENKIDYAENQQQPKPSLKRKRMMSKVHKKRMECCDMQIEKITDHAEEQQSTLEWKTMMMSSECCSLRKRRRKGIPQRAPLK